MTASDQMKTALSEKLDVLRSLGDAGPGVDEVRSFPPHRHMMSLVTEAMDRAGNEKYGLCLACEQRITPKRLAALPWARYCVACQDEVRLDSAA